MILTIDEAFSFLETTFVSPGLLKVLCPDGVSFAHEDTFVYENFWERRFDMDRLRSLWKAGHTFIIHSSNVSTEVRQVVEDLEREHMASAQAHVYMGAVGSRSFPIHADNPDNYIFQCVGQSRFRLYRETAPNSGILTKGAVKIEEERLLEPGDSVFIPALRYHFFQPLTERLSVSVPIQRGSNTCQLSSS
jgi:hypothetical protein